MILNSDLQGGHPERAVGMLAVNRIHFSSGVHDQWRILILFHATHILHDLAIII